MDRRNYLCPQSVKRMKLASVLTKHLNSCTSLPLRMKPNQNTSMLAEDDKKEKYLWGNKNQGVEEDQRDLVDKNLDNESVRDRLPRRIPQDKLLASESILSLRAV